MSKNITQNKTEFIQSRLDRDSKITAKALADKYFDGKMSAMFRYMLNNTDLTKMYNTAEANGFDRSCNTPFAGGSSTREVIDLLRSVYDEYKAENRELSAIGNNINQIAHHVNANAMNYPNPLTQPATLALFAASRQTGGRKLSQLLITKPINRLIT